MSEPAAVAASERAGLSGVAAGPSRRWWILGTAGAFLLVAAAVILGVIKGAPPVIPFVAELRLASVDWAVLGLVPVGAILLAMLVTRWTAYGLARRLP